MFFRVTPLREKKTHRRASAIDRQGRDGKKGPSEMGLS